MAGESTRRGASVGPRTAVTVGVDPREIAARLLDLHETWRARSAVPEGVRPVVARAWRRLSPATPPHPHQLSEAQVRERRANTPLADLLPGLRAMLLDVAVEASNELVVCDAEGYVLWLDGPNAVRRRSEQLGFVEGACWREDAVGANALGTALVDGEPVQLFGAEHTVEGHHPWVCTGAPLIDPASGACVGAFTLSGPLRSAHPNTLALVTAAARAAQGDLALGHRRRLDALAAHADDRAGIVVDRDGWVAAAPGYRVPERLWLPGALHRGTIRVPGLGGFEAEPVGVDGSGWRLRPHDSAGPSRLELTQGPTTTLALVHADRREVVPITHRQADILTALAESPAGLSATELAARVYGAGDRAVTARAEVSRLRQRLGDAVATRPYRLTAPLDITPPLHLTATS